jgi:asparagine synthetase B (glutamine-hydrolysing)
MSRPAPPVKTSVPELDPLEVSSGVVTGPRRGLLEEIEGEPSAGPRETLEQLLLEALQRPPCVVAFSGGRDSSAILAAVTAAARANGLEDPIPFTLRFGEAPRTDETAWQELVIRHLGLDDWTTRAVTDELDALGPLALGVLRRLGVHWPPNIHTFELLLEPAAGGSLVTGNGGDELFTAWGGHRWALLRRGRTLPRRADLRPLATALLPTPILATRPRFRLSWLRPAAARKVARRMVADMKEFEHDWAEANEVRMASRYMELATAATAAMAANAGVRLVEPFFDPRYVRAVYADAPPQGYPSRTVAMERNFGDILPPELPGRTSKAMFTEVFVGPETRRFATEWDGRGVDPELVDVEALRARWLADRADIRTLVPVQAAWLASQPGA